MMARTLSVGLLLALSACASQAPIRDNKPGTAPTAGSDEAELWYAMERAETELQRSPLRVRDPALNEYVRKVACEVAGEYCKDLRVYVMDVPQFNASMAPNGVMLVWTGALLRARDEAELAFVLGHEAGHFKAQHSLKQWRRVKDTSAFLSVFQVLAYGAGAPNAAMLGSLAGYATLFKFTRDQEREADRLGFQAIVDYGYDPRAGVDLWARMKREEDTRKYDKPSAAFSTHPATAERLADITAAANAVPNASSERHRDAYRTATRPYLERWLKAELARREYAASLLVIGDLLKDSPNEDRGLLTFYLAEAYRRRDAEWLEREIAQPYDMSDRGQASRLYAEAVRLPGVPPDAWREYGFSLRYAGRYAEARTALQRYLSLAPQAEDRAFVQRELDKLGGGS